MPLAAKLAVTTQLLEVVLVSKDPAITQPDPVTENDNAPIPEPPVVARDTEVPTLFCKFTLVMTRVV